MPVGRGAVSGARQHARMTAADVPLPDDFPVVRDQLARQVRSSRAAAAAAAAHGWSANVLLNHIKAGSHLRAAPIDEGTAPGR